MYLSPRLTQTISRYVDNSIVDVLSRMQERSACAGIPAKPGPRSRKNNMKEAQKARINHHGTEKIPARRFIYAPVGGYGEDVVPPEYYRQLRELMKNLLTRGERHTMLPSTRVERTRELTPTGVQIVSHRYEVLAHSRSLAFSSRNPETGLIDEKVTGYRVLEQIAKKMAELQKEYIMGRHVEENAEATVRSKRSKKISPPDLPLYETGKMLRAIDGWVE